MDRRKHIARRSTIHGSREHLFALCRLAMAKTPARNASPSSENPNSSESKPPLLHPTSVLKDLLTLPETQIDMPRSNPLHCYTVVETHVPQKTTSQRCRVTLPSPGRVNDQQARSIQRTLWCARDLDHDGCCWPGNITPYTLWQGDVVDDKNVVAH